MTHDGMFETGGARVGGFFCHRVTEAQRRRTEGARSSCFSVLWRCFREGTLKRELRVLVALLVLLGMTVGARAAELVQGRILSVGIGAEQGRGGMYRPGTWVPVRVRLENRSGKQFVGRLGVEQIDLDGDKVMSIGPKVILQASDVEGRDFWTYYWPRPDDQLTGISSVVVLDESGSQPVATIGTPGINGGAVGLDTRDTTNARSQRFVVLLGTRLMGFASYQESYGGNETVRFTMATHPNAFPDNVLGLDGVDLVVWQADEIKPSDMAPEFQQKAILDWVHAGGHLIVTVSAQGQELSRADERLRNAMPMVFTGTRTLKMSQLQGMAGFTPSWSELPKGLADEQIVQAIGTLKPGARVGSGGKNNEFRDNPLIVTGAYGQGAITVLTINAAFEPLDRTMNDESWMVFWNQVAGWQGGAGQMLGREKHRDLLKDPNRPLPPVHLPARELKLGEDIPRSVDVTEQTALRLLVAVLFLGLYWMAAGPIGHLILRYYKVVHWSWWIFGGTVVLAAGLAGTVVTFLQLTNYDLRHQTVVIGAVGDRHVTTVGFYGVYAPRSGLVEVSQPEGTGMNYIAPLNVPTATGVKPFADPQSYALWTEKAFTATPVFRNTLKKMQGRWTGSLPGSMPGIDGSATVEGAGRNLRLQGSLTNNSGYTLENVEILVHAPGAVLQGNTYMFHVGQWKAGSTLNLDPLKVETRGTTTTNPIYMEDVVAALARRRSERSTLGGGLSGGSLEGDAELVKGHSDDFLSLFLDARRLEALTSESRVEPTRTLTRTMDCTKLLHAHGAMIIGRAGNLGNQNYVKSPVPLSVNGRQEAGKGEVLFAWALPLSGTVQGGPASGIEAMERRPEEQPEGRPGPARTRRPRP